MRWLLGLVIIAVGSAWAATLMPQIAGDDRLAGTDTTGWTSAGSSEPVSARFGVPQLQPVPPAPIPARPAVSAITTGAVTPAPRTIEAAIAQAAPAAVVQASASRAVTTRSDDRVELVRNLQRELRARTLVRSARTIFPSRPT